MLEKKNEERNQVELICMEEFVPKEHLLRKIEYGMRYTNLRGLSQVTKWVRLKFAAMNLKKYAIHKWIKDGKDRLLLILFRGFAVRLAF